MKSRIGICAISAGIYVFGTGAALSEEQSLKFRLVTYDVEESVQQVAALPDRMMSMSRAIGVAVFEDGRIAFKKFMVSNDSTPDAGSFTGYSTYTFDNGDSITARFTGEWSASGVGGDYEVLSGTGAYSDVTGTGRFDALGTSWEDASLFEGTFTLDVPGGS